MGDEPIYPSQLPPNCKPRELRRMFASWRGRQWPAEVKIMYRLYKALIEQSRRFNAALDEVYALEEVIDRTRQRLTVDTHALVQEAKEKRASSAFLGQLWREQLSEPPKRQTAEREVFTNAERDWWHEQGKADNEAEVRRQREEAAS